jgi:hypothetical protein
MVLVVLRENCGTSTRYRTKGLPRGKSVTEEVGVAEATATFGPALATLPLVFPLVPVPEHAAIMKEARTAIKPKVGRFKVLPLIRHLPLMRGILIDALPTCWHKGRPSSG